MITIQTFDTNGNHIEERKVNSSKKAEPCEIFRHDEKANSCYVWFDKNNKYRFYRVDFESYVGAAKK